MATVTFTRSAWSTVLASTAVAAGATQSTTEIALTGTYGKEIEVSVAYGASAAKDAIVYFCRKRADATFQGTADAWYAVSVPFTVSTTNTLDLDVLADQAGELVVRINNPDAVGITVSVSARTLTDTVA